MTVLNPPADSTSSLLADWFELVLLIGERRVISPAKGHELLTGMGAAVDEVDVALGFASLHERCSGGHALYPFRFSRLGLERDPNCRADPYCLLLLLSAISSGSVSGDDGYGAVHLERFVAAALRSFWGSHTIAIRFGHPPEPQRPAGFADAIRWLGEKMNARCLPLSGAAFRRADGGVDVVAWRSYPDGKPGPSAVVQVTYESDLRPKSLEAAANDLDRWVAVARPLPVLASPFDGNSDPDLFLELNQRVLVLDRWRLLEYFDGYSPVPGADWLLSTMDGLTL